jgi:hypothetical protein
VIDIILDKGLVIDAYVRVSLVGIEILTVDARIVQGLPELLDSEHLGRREVQDQERHRGRRGGARRRRREAAERLGAVQRRMNVAASGRRLPFAPSDASRLHKVTGAYALN